MSSSYISATLRRQVVERAGNCCEYCRISQEDQFFSFEIDHIIAEKHGGVTSEDNLCLACTDCNGLKGSDIASVDWTHDQAIIGLYHPRIHIWNQHFSIDMTTGRIELLTSHARVTAFLLKFNSPDRLVDRQLLIADGRYPCAPLS